MMHQTRQLSEDWRNLKKVALKSSEKVKQLATRLNKFERDGGGIFNRRNGKEREVFLKRKGEKRAEQLEVTNDRKYTVVHPLTCHVML